MLNLDYINISISQAEKEIYDEEIKNEVLQLLWSIKSKAQDFIGQAQQIQEDDYFSEKGKMAKIKENADDFIQNLEKYRDNTIVINKRNLEVLHKAKLAESLKPDENKSHIYSEIRSRIIAKVGDDILALRKEYLNACSQGNKDVACALLSDPFGTIDEKTKMDGLRMFNGSNKGLESNPKYQQLSKASSIIDGTIKNIVLQLNRKLNARPQSSFVYDLSNLKRR